MSITEQAKYELTKCGFDEESKVALIKVLEIFFEAFDSGGAVHATLPILWRLFLGLPLSPLTGEDDEWVETMRGEFRQNRRCSSVFKTLKDIPHRGLVVGDCYDIEDIGPDNKAYKKIIFPYMPASRANIPSPLMEFDSKE